MIENEFFRLLIVDDEIQIRNGLKYGIDWTSCGISEVCTAENGIEAFSLFEKKFYDIVITDIKMPGLDGLQLSKKIIEISPDTLIVILSGYSEFEYAKTAIQIGVLDYELKPVNISALINTVKKGLESKKRTALHEKNLTALEDDEAEELFGKADYKAIENFINNKFDEILNAQIDEIEQIRRYFLEFNSKFLYFYNKSEPTVKLISSEIKTLENVPVLESVHNYKQFELRIFEKIFSRLEEFKPVANSIWLVNILFYIHENYSKEISVENIASLVNKSPNYVSGVFKKELGQPFIEYLNKYRINTAIELMLSEDLLVYEIAQRVGYTNYKYFNKMFKRITSMSPTDYKKNLHKKMF